MKAHLKRMVHLAFENYGRAQIAARELRRLPAQRAAEIAIAALPAIHPPLVEGPVLVDAAFQHPNFWQRFGLLRAALGFGGLEQHALPGRFSTLSLGSTLRRFGIENRLPPLTGPKSVDRWRADARALLARAGSPDGLFRAELPFGIPAFDLYDGLLRTQKAAIVDLGHPEIVDFTATWLAAAHAADDLVRRLKPGFAVLSHTQTGRDNYGAIARALIRHRVPLVLPKRILREPAFSPRRRGKGPLPLLRCGLAGRNRPARAEAPGPACGGRPQGRACAAGREHA